MEKVINSMVNKITIRKQLSFLILCVALIVIFLISMLSNILINKNFERYVVQQQEKKTKELIENIGLQYDSKSDTWQNDMIHAIGMYALYDGYILKIYNNHGISIWDTEKHDMSLCQSVMNQIVTRMEKEYPKLHGAITTKTYPILRGENQIGTAVLEYYGPYFLDENDFQFLKALNKILVSTACISFLGAFVVGSMIAKKISKPIINTVFMTKEISCGNYEVRLEEKTSIQELQQLVTSVNILADSLEKQERLRKQLTADVSHELRTPLTTVSTHLEAMIEGLWEPTKERLESCQEELSRLTHLVKDLEKLEKAESDVIKLKREPINMRELMDSVLMILEAEIYRKQLRVCILGETNPIFVDRDRIHQVMLNLLTNAIKYTKEGGKIFISFMDQKDAILMKIEDTGIGISKEEQPFIFERFYRADKSRNRKTGGSGIGLAIVHSIVKAHGGQIEVISEVDKGSQFLIKLPRKNESNT